MPELDFEFYAGGIEDGILEILTGPMRAIGVKTLKTYSGELGAKELSDAVAKLAPQFPLVMVSYAGGESTKMPVTSPVLGEPLHYRHDCAFVVIVASNSPMGENSRRRGKVYKMLSLVWKELTGRRLKKTIEDEDYLLNTQVLECVSNDFLAQLPEITAYAVTVETAFKWSSPDRTTNGTAVTEVVLGVDSNNDPQSNPGNVPGVNFSTGE